MDRLRYRIVFYASFLALTLERFWSAFWPVVSWVAFYAALALTGILTLSGGKVHLALLLAFIAGLGWSIYHYGRRFSWPRRTDVERQIEKFNHLPHRPLSTLHDTPVAAESDAIHTLWSHHVQKAKIAVANLRVYRPLPDTPRQDPYALRFGALMFLVIGLFVAGDDTRHRLYDSLRPDITLPFAQSRLALDIWITPPEYTGRPTVFLAATQTDIALAESVVQVPENSLLKIRVSGKKTPPDVYYADQEMHLTTSQGHNHTLEYTLEHSGELAVKGLLKRFGAWQIKLAEDSAPDIAISAVEEAARSATKITYAATDDYAVRQVTATVTFPETEDTGMSTPEALTFDIPAGRANADGMTSYTVDLTHHILAGEAAQIILTAEDDTGKAAMSDPYAFILPERVFLNPLAQKLIAFRKQLVYAQDALSKRAIAQGIMEIGSQPFLYKHDIVIFMALGTAGRRLIYDGSSDGVRSTQALLWEVALKLEDGGLSVAARDVQEAISQLQNALDNPDTPDAEIQEMMDAVSQKMQEYMRALMTEMAQRLNDGQTPMLDMPEIAEEMMEDVNLADIMRQFQEMSKDDPREALRQMSEFMKNLVENIDVNKMRRMQEKQQKAMQALQDIKELIREQQDLMDRTDRKAADEDTQEESREQTALRMKLGDMMRQLGEGMDNIPENFGNADQAMKKAREQLTDNRPKDATPHQKTALDELQKGMENAVKQMAQQMKRIVLSFGMGQGQQQVERPYGEGYDPLGRQNDGQSQSNEDVEIPEEQERRRVQEIIRELRDRSNDYRRPKTERDYLDRLLDNMN